MSENNGLTDNTEFRQDLREDLSSDDFQRGRKGKRKGRKGKKRGKRSKSATVKITGRASGRIRI